MIIRILANLASCQLCVPPDTGRKGQLTLYAVYDVLLVEITLIIAAAASA